MLWRYFSCLALAAVSCTFIFFTFGIGPGNFHSRALFIWRNWTIHKVIFNDTTQPDHDVEKFPRMHNTIVTAYFNFPSKHTHEEYLLWMTEMLSLRDAMVIFSTPDMISIMKQCRTHAAERTHFVSLKPQDLWIAQNQSADFWEGQLLNDPERDIHRSHELFWVWLSKTWFVAEAVRLNPFQSEIFLWSDIGSFRSKDYFDKLLIQHAELIPKTAMLMMAFQIPKPSSSPWVVKTIPVEQGDLYVSGAQMAGTASTWTTFHSAFLKTFIQYVERGLFVGEDQALLQSTCLQNPSICAFVVPSMVKGDVFFGLLDVLYSGGNVFHRDHALLFWLPTLMPPALPPSSSMGILCTLIKDEPDYVVWRWVTHHQKLGFDVVLYDHHSSQPPRWGIVHSFPGKCCEDDSDRCSACKECLAYNPKIEKREHGYTVCQIAAYADCLHRYGKKYEWIGNWDVDEYVFPMSNTGADLDSTLLALDVHPGNDSSVVPVVHMWSDNAAHKKSLEEKVRVSDFWSRIGAYDSVEFQCLKFGPRRKWTKQRLGDPRAHQWRAPYAHLGENVTCAEDVCETIGSVKFLSRTEAVVAMTPHSHELTTAHHEPWKNTFAKVRCHHYFIRSREHALLKSDLNHNTFISKQIDGGLFEDSGFYNTIHDPTFAEQNPSVPEICVAFLSCGRLEKLIRTFAGVQHLIDREPGLQFMTAIVDNGSSESVKTWIRMQKFDRVTLLKSNVGIAAALDILWKSCEPAQYIMNVEDDWLFNDASPFGVIHESMSILERHPDVLEVWLRNHDEGFQFMPNSKTSINSHFIRQLPTPFEPLHYYIQESSKRHFPWWGAYTNGASLKHAARLRSVGKITQRKCSDIGNCESEFTAKVAYLGWKAARLCWRNDSCSITSDNEPSNQVMFIHQSGARSPGHQQNKSD